MGVDEDDGEDVDEDDGEDNDDHGLVSAALDVIGEAGSALLKGIFEAS